MACWDNITILQAVDRQQERFGGGEVWGVDGLRLIEDVAGASVTDDKLWRGFIRELDIQGQTFWYAGPGGTYRVHSARVRDLPVDAHRCGTTSRR